MTPETWALLGTICFIIIIVLGGFFYKKFLNKAELNRRF